MEKISSNSFGCQTIRYFNYVYGPKDLIYPLGSSIIREIEDKEVARFTGTSIITYIAELEDKLVVYCYNCEGWILEREDLSVILKMPLIKAVCVQSLSVSKNTIAVSFVTDMAKNCVSYTYFFSDGKVTQLNCFESKECFIRLNSKAELIQLEHLDSKDSFRTVKVRKGDEFREISVLGDILFVHANADRLCFSSTKRQIYIYDMITLDQLKFIQLEGKGCTGVFCLREDWLYLTPEPMKVVRINIQTDSTETVLQDKSQIKQLNSGLNLQKSKLFVSNEIGMFEFDLTTGNLTKESYCESQSSFCGIDFCSDGSKFAFGGLEGLLTVKDTVTGEIIKQNSVGFGVRTVSWHEVGLVAGTLEGSLVDANNDRSLNLESSVNCLTQFILKDHKFLLAASSAGVVFVIDWNEFKIIGQEIVHPSQPNNQDNNFGSIKYFAEVWSIAVLGTSKLNLENEFRFISGSEDQTIRVVKYDIAENKFTEEKCIKNHSLAVTAVDWKNVGGKEIAISCSDDRYFCVYDVENNFTLTHKISTEKHIYRWYTLTYLKIDEEKQTVVMTTQNGYVMVYDLNKPEEPIICRKVHLGGIEGLAVKERIATCSSDMTVSLISYTV